MNKYLCLCGQGFNRKKHYKIHIEESKNNPSYPLHGLMKLKCSARLFSFILDLPWKKIFRAYSAIIIYLITLSHLDIKLNLWESFLIGYCFAILID